MSLGMVHTRPQGMLHVCECTPRGKLAQPLCEIRPHPASLRNEASLSLSAKQGLGLSFIYVNAQVIGVHGRGD